MRFTFLVALLTACSEFGLDPVEMDAPERVLVIDAFSQEPLPAVDLLFVIDDTPSMGQELRALADGFASLAGALSAANIRWQVGVVTMGMSGADAGWLRGAPWIITPETDQAADAFARAVPADALGAAPEAGLAAATLALTLSDLGGPNAGFRRPDAVLEVIFVSDGGDHSDAWLGSDPVGAFVDTLADEAARTGLPARASAIVGDLPSGCVSARGDARPGLRYHELIAEIGGSFQSICSADFAPLLAELGAATMAWADTFLLRALPIPESVRVTVDGVRTEAGWSLRLQQPAVIFDAPPPPGARIEIAYLVEVDG